MFLTCLIGKTELLCKQCRGMGLHLTARGKSHGFSLVVTWGIFLSYGGDYPSKLVFVQQRQDSCLVPSDTSGISSRFCRAIWTLLKVRLETQVVFLDATVILGFLSIFHKSQASSSFEALNSACLSRCQRDVMHFVQMRQGLRAFSRSPRRIQISLHLVRRKMTLHSSHCREILPSF